VILAGSIVEVVAFKLILTGSVAKEIAFEKRLGMEASCPRLDSLSEVGCCSVYRHGRRIQSRSDTRGCVGL
jgi:hypothetical protein